MAPTDPGTTDLSHATWSRRRRLIGVAALACSSASTLAWFGWRLSHLGAHPVELGFFMIEIGGLLTGGGVAIALMSSCAHRSVFVQDRRESRRYAFAVSDLVGRTRSVDLHREVRDAVRAAPRWRPRTSADVAIASVLLEGPRRLALLVVTSTGLLLGIAPFPLPPLWAIACAAVGAIAMSAAHIALGNGRIRFGDRTRWSNASLGEVFSPADHDDLAPRRWVGTVAVIVVVNLAVALRGMSDRWTHGLPPMADADRFVAMMTGIIVMVGALYTLRTMAAPQLPNAHLVSRHLEERTARQSALGAAVCVGLVGLVAGVLPGGVDAADGDPAGIELISDDERPIGNDGSFRDG